MDTEVADTKEWHSEGDKKMNADHKQKQGEDEHMEKKIKIRQVSAWSIGITFALAVLFAFISVIGRKEFHVLQTTTNQYIACEKAANQLQSGSDYLTEQARVYAVTGQKQYMDAYFEEATVTKSRENALDTLKQYFDETETFGSLKNALSFSTELMNTEYYSMRLVAEATGLDKDTWPEEISAVTLSEEDEALTENEKITRAQQMLNSSEYQSAKMMIQENVSICTDNLIAQTQNRQGRATTIFSDMYLKLELSIFVQVLLILAICFMMRKLIVKPLLSYNESIKKGEIFPVLGASELQLLAETYNKVYQENQETQKLIRHQAEHDALTDSLNRGSFEKILKIYDSGEVDFALILIDVDIFKSVNDTYGHAAGDGILKKVARLLTTTFRSIDFVCRIGGDEFSVIMVEMTSDLRYTIEEKIQYINEELSNPTDGLPPVSLSVGVAFSDRPNKGESIFKDADQALYYVKEHGRKGCSFYE